MNEQLPQVKAEPIRETYKGPIEVGMIFVANTDRYKPFRKIRILAPHPDGGWLYEDLPSKCRPRPFGFGRCPDFNLRYVFEPENNNAN